MSRSLKKEPFVDAKLLEKIKKIGKNSPIKTWARASMITPEMVGITFLVHNGKEHLQVKVVEEMVGHRLGEFSPTRKFKRHGGRMAKEQEQEQSSKTSSSAPSVSGNNGDKDKKESK
ncbi:MAG: 30S ribosomal protein S19 [Candidatus Berkelbacteria bacterium]|nr:30S ribosomal protein S19 [Candidatus Berkelbacteria bacterium]